MMKQPNPHARSIIVCTSLTMLAAACLSGQATAEMDSQTYAFPDRWMIRLSAYVVDGADTQVRVNSDVGLGTSIDYIGGIGRIYKIGKQAVNNRIEYYYNIEKPDSAPDWSWSFTFQFLFPK
jgi:hypothetical protein